jgi:hypothetical protein
VPEIFAEQIDAVNCCVGKLDGTAFRWSLRKYIRPVIADEVHIRTEIIQRGNVVSIGTIILIILVILLLGGFSGFGGGPFYGTGYYGGGGLGVVIVILLILILLGRI